MKIFLFYLNYFLKTCLFIIKIFFIQVLNRQIVDIIFKYNIILKNLYIFFIIILIFKNMCNTSLITSNFLVTFTFIAIINFRKSEILKQIYSVS